MTALLERIIPITVTLCKLFRPGGTRALIVENRLLKQQLIVLSRSHKRSPRLTALDRLIFGLSRFFISKSRLEKLAIIIKSATIIGFHRALVKRKYRKLYIPTNPGESLEQSRLSRPSLTSLSK